MGVGEAGVRKTRRRWWRAWRFPSASCRWKLSYGGNSGIGASVRRGRTRAGTKRRWRCAQAGRPREQPWLASRTSGGEESKHEAAELISSWVHAKEIRRFAKISRGTGGEGLRLDLADDACAATSAFFWSLADELFGGSGRGALWFHCNGRQAGQRDLLRYRLILCNPVHGSFRGRHEMKWLVVHKRDLNLFSRVSAAAARNGGIPTGSDRAI